MALENSLSFGSFSLPPLGDTSFSTTPQRAGSRRSSRRVSTSPNSSSPAPRADEQDEDQDTLEDKVSVLDPRRFTPTLHANLVSEILSLRREVESKNKQLLDLEENLSSIKDDNGKLNETLASREKERSNMRRQLQILETSTMSALDEMAQERDRSNDTVEELKKRLDAAQKKAKSKEEEVDRTNTLWVKDQERWGIERRQLDHKIHVVEGRLKTVLSEVEAVHIAGSKPGLESNDRPQSRTAERPHSRASERALSRASGARSSLSQRRSSSVSTDGAAKKFRLSHISEADYTENAATLADELRFDDEFDDDEEDDELVAPEAMLEEQITRARPFSAQSHRQSLKARKILGLDVGDDEDGNSRDPISDAIDPQTDKAHKGWQHTVGVSQGYTDAATQFSPPPSPILRPQKVLSTIEEVDDDRSAKSIKLDNARRYAGALEPLEKDQANGIQETAMVSSACQTVEQLPSPPYTPTESKETAFHSSTLPKTTEMYSSSTQTVSDHLQPLRELSAHSRNSGQGLIGVPTISIRPPSSRSQRESVVLPPHTRSAGCQVYMPPSAVRSSSAQTEEIRIDNRPIRLPPHLLPSSISSNPSSPVSSFHYTNRNEENDSTLEEDGEQQQQLKTPFVPNRSAKRVSARSKERHSRASHSENNDDNKGTMDIEDGNASDADSFVTKEPIKKTLSKVQNSWRLVNQPADLDDNNIENAHHESGTATIISKTVRRSVNAYSKDPNPVQNQVPKINRAGKTIEPININKSMDVRKSAMITSGTNAHIQRARSPSAPPAPGTETSLSTHPPFPVPTRSSSRNIPWGSSDGTASPTPQTVTFFGINQQTKQKRPPTKKPVLRKIRSATNDLYKEQRTRSRSPPPSGSSFPDSPQLPSQPPPLPNDDINSPFRMAEKPGHRSQKPSIASVAESVASEQTSVVDAIAQTMIGEWMWKYVRRRTTFGREIEFDGRSNETTNGVRHQRWVWLAPYERAVLWSSKQPTSNSALLGKSGRKLAIQSVLDVRDDAPLPKNAGSSSCFGRSILILTPQRALKFTATTRERHYVWLKALSFLSSSSVVPSEVGVSPPAPSVSVATRPPSSGLGTAAPPPPPPSGSLRRHPIRDSIRIAKGKSRPAIPTGRRAHTDPKMQTLQSSQLDYVVDEPDAESGAEAPTVPRRISHTRKRSNTGPKATSASFRSISSSARPSMHSLHGSSRGQTQAHSLASRPDSEASHGWATDSGAYSSLGKHSLGSDKGGGGGIAPGTDGSSPAYTGPNPFEAMGTVRMEAFVKKNGAPVGPAPNSRGAKPAGLHTGSNGVVGNGPLSAPLESYEEKGRAKEIVPERRSYRTRQGRKKDLKYWGATSDTGKAGVTSHTDPFEGF